MRLSQRAKVLQQKRDEGTSLFRRGDWRGAHGAYTEALEASSSDEAEAAAMGAVRAKLFLNRAIAAAKVGHLLGHEEIANFNLSICLTMILIEGGIQL